MIRPQLILDLNRELIVDLFAGGGGMSTAIEMALGRHVDIAANHDEDATSMHQRNHPQTVHYVADVYEIDPREVTQGRPVGLLHLSPDCTHHSQAKAGQPREAKIRSLIWVAIRWMGTVRPRVVTIENVKQIRKWGPLVAKRCKATGRVVKIDGTVAAPGEIVPVRQQYLIPNPKREGRSWRRFKHVVRSLGYDWADTDMVAADYGAPTTRDRMFAAARCDGVPITFPPTTHAKKPARSLLPWRPAWECLDFTLPCPSIFTRPRPLADATLARIAEGIVRFVIEHADPFIVPVTHSGDRPPHDVRDPLRTITGAKRGEFALIAPTLCGVGGRAGQTDPRSAADPMWVITSKADTALTVAYLAQANGGVVGHQTYGRDLRQPTSTISTKGSQQQLVTAHLAHLQNNCFGRDMRDPLRTIKAGGQVHGLVECNLSDDELGALRVAAFLIRYYSHGGQWGDLRDPLDTITVRHRLALVTVTIRGEKRLITDVGLRMLVPRELYLCQGFPRGYTIDVGHDGRAFTKEQQVKMCGNSVSPPPAAALIRHLVPELAVWFRGEERKLTPDTRLATAFA